MKEQKLCKQELVDYSSLKIEILKNVSDKGPLGDMKSWKNTYPDLEFEEVDEVFSGRQMNWDKRTVEERCFYVAFMIEPQATEVSYELNVDGSRLWAEVNDSEKIWWMWVAGCFSGEEEMDEEAKKTFLWYAAEGELARILIGDMDLAGVEIRNILSKVAPL